MVQLYEYRYLMLYKSLTYQNADIHTRKLEFSTFYFNLLERFFYLIRFLLVAGCALLYNFKVY